MNKTNSGIKTKARGSKTKSTIMENDTIKTLELDKICRVCLTVKKDMRPLYGEMVAEMLMECARIQVVLFAVASEMIDD